MSPRSFRIVLTTVAALTVAAMAAPTMVLAQSATATASGTAQIIEPIGILAAAGASAGATPTDRVPVAQITAGTFSLQGPANQVVSVSTTLPSSLRRAGGGQALPVVTTPAGASRMLTPAGVTAFQVAAAASVQGAPGGLYVGEAEVVVNLN